MVGPYAAPRPAKPSPETELGLAGRAFSQSSEQRLTNNSGSNYAENKPVLAWSSSALRRLLVDASQLCLKAVKVRETIMCRDSFLH